MSLIVVLRAGLKKHFDRIRNERFKKNLLQAVPFWIASVLTGLIAVTYAKIFAFAEKGASFFYHLPFHLFFFITPLCFLLAWWVVKRWAPYAKGSGIPQVSAAIELATPRHNDKVDSLLSIRIILVKIISSCVLLLGGGITGREGPTIQIAGSVFRKVNLLLPDWWPKISKRNMIMTGAAAGLAAAFNTPLGGIVFAVEELTKTHISYFKTAIFSAVIIAGLVAQAFLGPYLYLGYPDVGHLSGYVFLGVALIAIVAGLGGSLMSKCILVIMRLRNRPRKKYKQVVYILVCALAIAVMGSMAGEQALGSGKELMNQVLFTGQKHVEWYMPLLRIIGPVLTFTTGAAGGVFAPALSAGAGIGSVMSGWLHFAATDSNLLILAGMVAFLTGVTRSPFTSAILVLEMTDRHNVIFHLMLAGMIAAIVSVLVDKHSFYDHLKHQYIHELTHEKPVVPVSVT